MSTSTRKRTVATVAVVAGMLVAAAPANAGIAVGNPPTHQGGAVVASRAASTAVAMTARHAPGLNEPRTHDPAQLQSTDYEI